MSAIIHVPMILLSSDILLEYWNQLPDIVLTFLTLTFCCDVSGFVTDCPCDPYLLDAGSFLDTSMLNKIVNFHFHLPNSYLHIIYSHLQ